MNNFSSWEQKSRLLRKLVLTSTSTAGSGHPSSCLSSTDIMTVLFDKYFTYDLNNPTNITNDRLIFSKGHAAPLFYALYALAGALPLEELQTLRKFGSRLEGHPTSHFPFTDAATGSLGQGLSVGAGMAYGIKKAAQTIKNQPKVYVLLGDGELAEGQIWEAANFASINTLSNLVAIADINRLAQSQETMFGYHIDEYRRRFEAFGFGTIVVDGHDFEQIDKALQNAASRTAEYPLVILAQTIKGKGISFMEDKDGWHGKALKEDELEKALSELGNVDESLRFELKKPPVIVSVREQSHQTTIATSSLTSRNDTLVNYKKGDEIATREAYGQTLSKLGQINPLIYALDGDVKNSTFSQDFLKDYPDRFIECFIAEQNMVSIAVGLSRLGLKPFVSTFAAFFTRAADQIRMAALSRANINFTGSHVGVSIGEDGASQMGLEDISLFGTLPDSIVVQPADAIATVKILPLLADYKGISYMRTLRSKTPIIYDEADDFPIGGSKVLFSSDQDVLTVAATGITVGEAIKAHATLMKEGISIRVIDCYSIKPVDKDGLLESLAATKAKTIITVEDHFIHGGLGDFVLEALAETDAHVKKLAVDHVSRSGSKEELLRDAKIDADAIIESVKHYLL
ncbi:transketolase [soil metagenome]